MQITSNAVQAEKERLLDADPKLDVDRLRFQLEIYEKYDHEPDVMKRARLFAKLCEEKTIFIDENPIVGTLTKYKYGGCLLPEIGSKWLLRAKEFYLQRGGRIQLEEGDAEAIQEAARFWLDRSIYAKSAKIFSGAEGVDLGTLMKAGLATELTPGGFVQAIPDYSRALSGGLSKLVEEVEAARAAVVMGDMDSVRKLQFYDASLITLKALMTLSERYAALARDMARGTKSKKRASELRRIAETCEWVPRNPPRTFREAVQFLWFCMLGVWIEGPVVLYAPPLNFGAYMYPYYEKDVAENAIGDDEVIETLQFLFLKINGLAQVLPPHGRAFSSSRIGAQLSLGGYTKRGEDATNKLHYLVLDAQDQLRMPEPLVNVMYHNKLSNRFLMRCADLVATGIGQPAFQSCDTAAARHLYHDQVTMEEARSIAVAGCVQSVIPGRMYFVWEGYLNTPKCLELALNDGVDPLTKAAIGLKTGTRYDSFEALYEAVKAQLRHFILLTHRIGRVSWNMAREHPSPFASSALMHDCVRKGLDLADGGPDLTVGDGVSMVGVVDLTNSLVAIKKLVFEQKKLSLDTLKTVLAANFEGYADVRELCLAAPKYGNDDPEVDGLAREIYEHCWDVHQAYQDFLNHHTKPQAYSVIAHTALGASTGALPNGRKARTALTDATVSAQPGTDTKGPTALIMSAARVLDPIKYGSNHFNVKLHPSSLATKEKKLKFIDLVRTYMDLGGYHVQFNCVDSKVLKEAQKAPEKYKSLVVRVAGFSAYFVTLDPATQNEIIARTEQHLA